MKHTSLLPCVILIFFGVAGFGQEADPEVVVAVPVTRMVTDYEEMTGRLEPAQRVDLRSRVTGYISSIHVEEGAAVKRGQLLFDIDRRPYEAQLGVAQAQLALSEANLQLAKVNAERAQALAKAGAAGTRMEVDKAQAEANQAAASVAVARANLDLARLQLEFTRIIAPIDGYVGRQLVQPGNLAKADDTLLATLMSRDPIRFTFAISETSATRLLKSRREGKLKEPLLALGLASEDGFPRQGTIDFVDNQFDPNTGTLQIRGMLANAADLLPGMAIRGRLAVSVPYQALLIPAKAVVHQPVDGKKAAFVFTVKDNVLARQRVELGMAQDGLVVVKSGVKLDDQVVLEPAPGLASGQTVRSRLTPSSK